MNRTESIAALVAAMDSANSVREPAGPTADVNTPAPDATEHAPGAGAPDTTKARPACHSTPDLPRDRSVTVRRPFGVEIGSYERDIARQALRDPVRRWESAEDARDFYARCIADAVLRGQKPCGYWLYAFAVAARLHDVQTRRDFPDFPRHLLPL